MITDQINHPSHYTGHPSGIEAIDLCEILGFNCGCAFKYLFRRNAKHESPITDLKKAVWYLQREAMNLNGGIFVAIQDIVPAAEPEVIADGVVDELLVLGLRKIVPHEPKFIANAMIELVWGWEWMDPVRLFLAAHFVEQEIERLTTN